MNRIVCISFLLCTLLVCAQEKDLSPVYVLDVNPFYGSILLHNTDISHLIREHPAGLILGISRKTFGEREWEQEFGYPDTGFSFIYQDMKTAALGDNFGFYGHYNFYFFRRALQFRLGQGIAYNTNPYDTNQNFRGNAYGSHLMSSTFVMLNYYRENLLEHLGFRAGFSLVHYSNANVKAPNTSTNTLAFNAGLIYRIGENRPLVTRGKIEGSEFAEPLRINIAFRSGINESDVINSGQFPFYILSSYLDKRINRKSALQFGMDVFFSNFLKELIRFQAISFPELDVDEGDDYKRLGLFLGHELFINKLSVITQLGYYVYYPFDFEGRVYNRIGIKRYFGPKWYGAITLKSHAAAAEAIEFGVGVRL